MALVLTPRAVRLCQTCDNDLTSTETTYCSSCRTVKAREYRATNPHIHQRASREWRGRNKDQRTRIDRNSKLKSKFGITADEFDAILASQDFKCASCGDSLRDLKRAPHMDHNHETGKLREILCGGCNLAIGHLRDSPNRAESLAAYLRKHNGGIL